MGMWGGGGGRKRKIGRKTEGSAKSCWQVGTNKAKPPQNVLLLCFSYKDDNMITYTKWGFVEICRAH